MAAHQLSANFASFFRRLNPGTSFESIASSQYNTIKDLIENRQGPAAALWPICFLQGSYKQQTAIHAINDVDIVVLCQLWNPTEAGNGGGTIYGRDQIFDTIAAPLRADGRYAGKIRYGSASMCIKVDLGIKVEILPVVYKQGNNDSSAEPFRLYRPEVGQFQDGYARYHQAYLTMKNAASRTGGNFIPMIKVLKHLRSLVNVAAVSFHLECLLYAVPDAYFLGSPADYIPAVLNYIAGTTAPAWYLGRCMTPCGERDIFTGQEWTMASWTIFHDYLGTVWAILASAAANSGDRTNAIRLWRIVLGEDYFPLEATA
jgi:hypothetical protein